MFNYAFSAIFSLCSKYHEKIYSDLYSHLNDLKILKRIKTRRSNLLGNSLGRLFSDENPLISTSLVKALPSSHNSHVYSPLHCHLWNA